MSITRNFKLFLNAGNKIPLVIHANQYDQGETWNFTLLDDSGQKYTPSAAALVGTKADGNLIANAATVSSGIVVVTETEQMTAAAGKANFELLIDSQTHGTANFVVMVEESPTENGVESDSDLSLFQEAIDSTSATHIASAVSTWLTANLSTPSTPPIDTTLTVSSAAADAKATGDAITILNSALANITIKDSIKQALLALADAVAYKDTTGATVRSNLYDALYEVDVISLTASFTQGDNVIYTHDSLDDLKQYLTVTAYYDNATNSTVTAYTLSGSLTEGTSTITVTYNDVTTTFTVTVTAGVPTDTYTLYDYVQTTGKYNNATSAQWITLNSQTNLDILSMYLEFGVLTGYTVGTAMFGVRTESGYLTSNSVYIGENDSTHTQSFRLVWHGVNTYSDNNFTLDSKNVMQFTNTSSSPSSFNLNGTETSVTWDSTKTNPYGFTLFTNPKYDATSMTLIPYLQIGHIMLTDLNGNVTGNYYPVLRTADNVIGMYDTVSETLYTSATASYSTVGNSNCRYQVGNWS